MPITQLEWFRDAKSRVDGSRDRHVLRTVASPGLVAPGTVRFFPETGPPVFAEAYLGGDVTLEFRPLFLATREPTRFTGFGIHVEIATGAVSCDPTVPPPNAPRSFLVELSVVTNGGRVAPVAPLLVRVHLHEAITKLRLSPAELTIHRDAAVVRESTQFGFTALAEFTDGTMGDVTLNHALTWTPESPLDIETNGFVILASANVTGTRYQVTAVTPAPWGSIASTPVHILVADSWEAVPAPVASLIDGPPNMWTVGTADATANVLFLGSGFPDEDTDAYNGMLQQVCHLMRRVQITRPYDLLADSLTFWRLQVPSKTRGISVRCEVRLVVSADGRIVADPFPPAKKPPGPGTPWNAQHLFYSVGLPVAADATDPSGTAP